MMNFVVNFIPIDDTEVFSKVLLKVEIYDSDEANLYVEIIDPNSSDTLHKYGIIKLYINEDCYGQVNFEDFSERVSIHINKNYLLSSTNTYTIKLFNMHIDGTSDYYYQDSDTVLQQSENFTFAYNPPTHPYFIINYHSNYADYVRTPSQRGSILKKLNPSEDIIVVTKKYYYYDYYPDSLYNYSGHSHSNNLIMLRHGYLPTRYWNSEPDGSGIRFDEGTGTGNDYYSGEDIARAFGITGYDKVTIDVYPEWILQDKVWLAGDSFWASNYYQTSQPNIRMDEFGRIYYKTLDNNSSFINKDGKLNINKINYGSPKYPAASGLIKAYNELGNEMRLTNEKLLKFTTYV